MLHDPWMKVAFEALVGALLEALTKGRQPVCSQFGCRWSASSTLHERYVSQASALSCTAVSAQQLVRLTRSCTEAASTLTCKRKLERRSILFTFSLVYL